MQVVAVEFGGDGAVDGQWTRDGRADVGVSAKMVERVDVAHGLDRFDAEMM